MKEIVLIAEARDIAQHSKLTNMRAGKKVPAIVYGNDQENKAIIVSRKELIQAIQGEQGLNAIISLKTGTQVDKVLVHEIQRDVISREIIHVDFHRINMAKKIKVKVSVHLHGDAEGHKEGGVVQHILREIEVACLPTDIPSAITVDISALKIGDAIVVKDLAVPNNVSIVSAADAIVVHVVNADKEEVVVAAPVAAEASAEPEVIAKGKEKLEGKEGEPAAKPEDAVKTPAAGAKDKK
jgi:large subunit ribosomal protein L25